MIVVYVLAGLYGLCIGSFLNVVIYRLPRNMSLAKPGSHCTSCGYFLKWYDNIPVLSYLMLGGKCRSCKAHISFRYTAVELLNAVLWLLAALFFWQQSPLYAVAVALACSLLICIGFIDLETMYIHDILVYLLALPAILAVISGVGGSLWEHLIGFAAGGGAFLLFYLFSRWILKKEALGVGDILLVAVTGLFLGWKATLLAVLTASLLACLIMIPAQILGKKEKHTEYPFAPFLSAGAVAAMFLSKPLIGWYLGLFEI